MSLKEQDVLIDPNVPGQSYIHIISTNGYACIQLHSLSINHEYEMTYEPRCEKIGLWGFRPGPTLTGLCNHRWLKA